MTTRACALLPDEEVAELRLAAGVGDGQQLVAWAQLRVRARRLWPLVADEDGDRASLRQRQVAHLAADDGRVGVELGLDDLDLAALQLGQVEEVMDRDLVLDDAEDRARRAHRLVDRELPEELLVLRVVDAGDR